MSTTYTKSATAWVLAVIVFATTLLVLASIILYVSPKPELRPTARNSSVFYSSEGKLLRLTLSADDQSWREFPFISACSI